MCGPYAEGLKCLTESLSKIGAFLLSTAIGEIMEDGAPGAITKPKAGINGFGVLAASLAQDGRDIAVLAEAVTILVRRCEPST